ncbi:MAG: GrpB family protein [Paramuribaculum sp.]|nr:GrpB family protein [Paramuribaculum sp.]
MGKPLQDMTLEELWELFPIELAVYNPDWVNWADREIKDLSVILSDFCPALNHIGSTAIPGILSKPIVDILVEVPADASYSEIRDRLESNGYICMAEDKERINFNKGYTPDGYADKVFHIHVRRAGDNDEILFRDYLRNHPRAREEYEMLKSSLLPEYKNDRDGYTAAKTLFVRRIMCAAEKERDSMNNGSAAAPAHYCRRVEVEETVLVDGSYFPGDYELPEGYIDENGTITLLRGEGLEFIMMHGSLAVLSGVDSCVGEQLEVPEYVCCGNEKYNVFEVSLARPNHTVRKIILPDGLLHFENSNNFRVLEKIIISPEHDRLIVEDDVLYWKHIDGTLHIEAIPVLYQGDKIVLREYVVDSEYEVADWLACTPAPKDVVYENPAKYLSVGKPGKLVGDEVICGIFHCEESSGWYTISRIDSTDDDFIVIPKAIITEEWSGLVTRIDLTDDNPVSATVKTIYAPCQADEDGIDFFGDFSVIFPALENILLCGEELLPIPDGEIADAFTVVGDEELVVIKDSAEYRESLMTPEELAEFKEEGWRIEITTDRYWIKSAYAEFLYVPETGSVSVEKIYAPEKSIVIPPAINAMGKRLEVTSVCLSDADENDFEVLWVPAGCRLEGICGINLKAIRFYKP